MLHFPAFSDRHPQIAERVSVGQGVIPLASLVREVSGVACRWSGVPQGVSLNLADLHG